MRGILFADEQICCNIVTYSTTIVNTWTAFMPSTLYGVEYWATKNHEKDKVHAVSA